MISLAEGGAKPPSEFRIGQKVFILQHTCFPGRLGAYGRVDSMKGGVPVTAKCDDCGQSIGVNLKAMQELRQPKKPKV